jgi:hypothetical protein
MMSVCVVGDGYNWKTEALENYIERDPVCTE